MNIYIKRDQLLNKLIRYRKKDIVKVITGIRRCGKSVLLNELFYEYLLITMDRNPLSNLENGYQLMHLFDFLLNAQALEMA